MPWMSRWPRKNSRQTSTDNTEDATTAAMLAEATYIANNPEEFLGMEDSIEVGCEAVAA